MRREIHSFCFRTSMVIVLSLSSVALAGPGILHRRHSARRRAKSRRGRPRRRRMHAARRRRASPSMRRLKSWALQMFVGMPSGSAVVAGQVPGIQEGVGRLKQTVQALQQQTGVSVRAMLARTSLIGKPLVVPMVQRTGGRSLSSDWLKCSTQVVLVGARPPGYTVGAVLFGVDVSGVFTEVARAGKAVRVGQVSRQGVSGTESILFKGLGLMANRTYVIAMSLRPRWRSSSGLLLGRTVSFHVPWPFERFLTAPFPKDEKTASHMVRDRGIVVRPRLVRSRRGAFLRMTVQVPGYLRGPGRWLVLEASTGHGENGAGAERWTEFRYALPLDRPTWVLGDFATTNLDLSRPLRRPDHAWIRVRAAVVWNGHIRFSERRLQWSRARRKWL